MTTSYSKGTQVWLADSSTSWKPATVISIASPADNDPNGEVTMVISHDEGSSDAESKTLKFPLSALIAATDGANGIQPPSPVPGQDVIPQLRNPPVLASAEDLSALSNLNEPSGESHPPSEDRAYDLEAYLYSAPCYCYSIRYAPAIHILWYRPCCSQPFQPSCYLRTRNDSIIRREEEGRSGTASLCYR